ncbi:carboxypeptidase B-like [Nymphalis io]|uniref:carboxypeptidase B-like n=1 Tax=Inachis io TaxID=171585 RepID=UPI0021672CE3|nr:carboxypeptidase B-like [Nymphalis io]
MYHSIMCLKSFKNTNWIVLYFGLLGLLQQVECVDNKYDNYTLIRLYPSHTQQIEALEYLEKPEHHVEILKKSRSFNDSTDILVPPSDIPFVKEFIKSENLNYELKRNYGRTFETVERTPKRRVLRGFSVFEYHSFSAIQEYIDNLAKRQPDLVKLQNLGTSYQGRRMKLVKISSDHNAQNPIIFVDAGIHAREWVAPAMALYLIHRLVNDPDARKELDGVDWYILPVVNPDGYEYTRTNRANRLWRKTRSKNSQYECFGVDGNRNYGFKWAVSGISTNPCDKETYAGPKPFSEVETQMVRNIMMENSKRMKLYVSLHSYGQYLVYPWGYTGEYLPKEWKKLDTLARMVSDAVQKAGGQPFKVLSAGKWYAAAGGSDDYAFGAVGVPYSYTMELTNGYEFIYPERLLRTVLPQYYEGFRTFAAQIKKEFCLKYIGQRCKFATLEESGTIS